MVAMAPGEVDLAATKNDFLTYFGLGIHISRRLFSNGKVQRYADEIVKFDPTAPNGKFWPILKQGFEEYDGEIHRWWEMYPLPDDLKETLRIENNMAPGQIDNEWVPTYKYESATQFVIEGYETTGKFETITKNGKKYYKLDQNKKKIPVYKLDSKGEKTPIYKKDAEGNPIKEDQPKRNNNGDLVPITDDDNNPIIDRTEVIFDFNDFK